MGARLLRVAVRRTAFAVVLIFLASSGAMLLTTLAPGDFTAELVGTGASAATMARQRADYGLDQPIINQYGAWLRRSIRLDLGTSLLYRRPVGGLVAERAANTAILALLSLGLATAVGVSLGVVAGSRRGTLTAAVLNGLAIVALSIPPLLSSILLALLAARTGWFPIGGMASPVEESGWLASWLDFGWHLVLPSVALALPIAATLQRIQSQAIAEVMDEPYIAAARAKGVPEWRVVSRHALRPAIKPVASIYGIIFGTVMSGSFSVEIVTAWPGLGRLMYDALVARDVYLVAGCATAGAVFIAAGILLSDILLTISDPRMHEAA